MRRSFLMTLTILVLVLAVRAGAQFASPPLALTTASVPAVTVTPDLVVTRLMSFDRDGDGLVARDELPERMQDVLTRGDVSNDQALDRDEVRKLATRPAAQVAARGFQPGVYGFGGTTFDTRLHIEGAIDDLRLASETRQKALEIASRFKTVSAAEAKAAMLATMSSLLTAEQLEDFTASLDGRSHVVAAFKNEGGVTFFGANADDVATQKLKTFSVRLVGAVDPMMHIEKLDLAPAPKQRAVAAIQQFKMAQGGQLTEADRAALVDAMQGILADEQRADLRAALDRRPIVKQTPGFKLVTASELRVVPMQQGQPMHQGQTLKVQNLLLTK
jgi:hypothetical protein